MAVTRKRTSRKTGNYTRSTTTISNRGVTRSHSSKPPGGATRRTVSYGQNGSMRETNSTRLGGGWTRVSTKTYPGSKIIGGGRRTRSYRGRGDVDLTFVWKFIAFVFKSAWYILKGTGKTIAYVYRHYLSTTNDYGFKLHMKAFFKTILFFVVCFWICLAILYYFFVVPA